VVGVTFQERAIDDPSPHADPLRGGPPD